MIHLLFLLSILLSSPMKNSLRLKGRDRTSSLFSSVLFLIIITIFLNCYTSTAKAHFSDTPFCGLVHCSNGYDCDSYCERCQRGVNVKPVCLESGGPEGGKCVCVPTSSTSNERNYFPGPSSSRKLLTSHQDRSVSHAREAVFSESYQDIGANGTVIAILSKYGVVLVGERDHVACAVAGIMSDANILINIVQAHPNTCAYQGPMRVEQLVQSLCDTKQGYTQFGGLCPFGVSFLFVGWDRNSGFRLYMNDCSGNYGRQKAAAVGANNQATQSMLKQDYKDDIMREEAVQLALKVLGKTIDNLSLTEVFLTPLGDVKYHVCSPGCLSVSSHA